MTSNAPDSRGCGARTQRNFTEGPTADGQEKLAKNETGLPKRAGPGPRIRARQSNGPNVSALNGLDTAPFTMSFR